jgi:hypothetical protein
MHRPPVLVEGVVLMYHTSRKTVIAALSDAAHDVSAVARAAKVTVPPPVRDGERDIDLDVRFGHVSLHLCVLDAEGGACESDRIAYATGVQPDFGERTYSEATWGDWLARAATGLRDAAFAADDAVALAARLANRDAPQPDGCRVAALAAMRGIAEAAEGDARAALARAHEAVSRIDGAVPAHLAAKLVRVADQEARAADALRAARRDAAKAAAEVASGIGWLPSHEGGEYWSDAFARERDAVVNAAFAADEARTISARLACEVDDHCQGVSHD